MKFISGLLATVAVLGANVALAAPAVQDGLVGADTANTALMGRNEGTEAQAEKEIKPDTYSLIKALSTHEKGLVSLGDDGVLRSFHLNGTVLDYVKLGSDQIQHLIDDFGRNDELTEAYKGVYGHDVTDLE